MSKVYSSATSLIPEIAAINDHDNVQITMTFPSGTIASMRARTRSAVAVLPPGYLTARARGAHVGACVRLACGRFVRRLRVATGALNQWRLRCQ